MLVIEVTTVRSHDGALGHFRRPNDTSARALHLQRDQLDGAVLTDARTHSQREIARTGGRHCRERERQSQQGGLHSSTWRTFYRVRIWTSVHALWTPARQRPPVRSRMRPAIVNVHAVLGSVKAP